MEFYKVNGSAIQQYMKCPFRWWAQYVMNWVPRQEAEPLVFGRLLHLVFEDHAKGKSMEVSIGTRIGEWMNKAMSSTDAYERDVLLKAIKQLDELSEALEQWEDKFDLKTIEAEVPISVTHPFAASILLVGRPDRVVTLNDKLWHVQNRGLSSSTNFGVYIDLAVRHYHEHIYAEALSKKYPDIPYGGTIFNLVRKLKYRTKITKKNPQGEVKSLDQMFFQHPMGIDLRSPLHNHIMNSILYWIDSMIVTEEEYNSKNIIPAPNEGMNGGMYGNSPDVYFRVLTGEIELGDERYFKRREDTYVNIEASE